MRYKLYTLVDITNTDQYKSTIREQLRWKEQNFNTVLQTLGLRANISYYHRPTILEVCGKLIGFDTSEIIRVWRFDFDASQDDTYLKDNNPIGHLIDDFDLVPYINGLDELMSQNYAVFVTRGDNRNIVFHIKQ